MKKFLSLVLALVMTMSLVTISAGAKEFKDDDKITYEEAVAVISEIGVVDGYADGSFNPTNVLTRQAAAKIICNMILGPTTASELHADTAPYKDVPLTSEFAGYIAYCQKEGIISGYADGTFKPGNTLTGYAFMKMLLGALGYDAEREGYTGGNWSINVAKQALNIGLNKSLEGDFNGIKAVNREEACLYAFNTLQADLVEYSGTIVVGGVAVTGTDEKAMEWKNSATRIDHIKDDNYVQFAEQYFPKLVKEDDVDAFGRPGYTWVYNKKDIGTYVDWTLMVAEFEKKVKGGDIYDELGTTAIKNADLSVWIDGVEDADVYKKVGGSYGWNSNNINKNLFAKNNDTTLDQTGNGVLTQLFYDSDKEEITIVEINSYLAKASGNYNEKSDSVNLAVYAYRKDSTNEGKDVDFGNSTTLKVVAADDVAAAADVKKDDYVVVTIAAGDVQSIDEAEIISNTSLNRYVKDKSVTSTEGTQYDFANTMTYDATILYNWDIKNMANTTYNLYLAPNGYLVGIDEYESNKDFVFITGFDLNGSYIAYQTADANAIFTDGTMKTIEVNVKDTNENLPVSAQWNSTLESSVVNTWYSFTEEKDGTYTLDVADQVHDTVHDIKGSYVGLQDTATSSTYRYGNNNTNYILVDPANDRDLLKDSTGRTDGDLYAITDIDSVITAVKSTNIDVYLAADATGEDCETSNTAVTTSYGSYGVYDDSRVLIAVVVVGENDGVTAKYAYVVDKDPNDETIRSDSEGYWYWTFDAITKDEGYEPITVKAKAGKLTTIINAAGLYELKTDVDGNVVDADLISPYGWTLGDKYIAAPDVIDAGTTKAMKYVTTNKLATDGESLWAEIDGNYMRGFALAAGYQTFVIQDVDGEEVTAFGDDAIAAVASLYKNDGTASKDVYALFNTLGEADLVIIRDNTKYSTSQTGNYGSSGQLTLHSLAASSGNLNLTFSSTVAISNSATAVVTVTNENGKKVVNNLPIVAANINSGSGVTANTPVVMTIPYAGTVGGSADYVVDVTITDGANVYYIINGEVGMI